MAPITRRAFLLSSAALPLGCATNRGPTPEAAPVTRAPQTGQTWRYAKRDLFTRSVVDTQIDRIAAIGRTIDIESHTEGTSANNTAQGSLWGLNWLRRYFDHPKPGIVLPSEVQTTWGMILVDPHWARVQLYQAPIPLWPLRMVPGWRAHIRSKYKSPDSEAELRWDQTMKAEAWETIAVPAGQFTTLRYINDVRFQASDPARTDSRRHETIWFAPETGRWVARESAGTYYLDNSVDDQPHDESSYRWELLAWT
jgi:hypothetical protein